jgi:hypothetical protein
MKSLDGHHATGPALPAQDLRQQADRSLEHTLVDRCLSPFTRFLTFLILPRNVNWYEPSFLSYISHLCLAATLFRCRKGMEKA